MAKIKSTYEEVDGNFPLGSYDILNDGFYWRISVQITVQHLFPGLT